MPGRSEDMPGIRYVKSARGGDYPPDPQGALVAQLSATTPRTVEIVQLTTSGGVLVRREALRWDRA